ncbi:MAG: hypothetical protein K2Q18_16505 [Bdellovibrionales bacterium]|nr:hypothetical protein [Bdellovibrionales bacterium]
MKLINTKKGKNHSGQALIEYLLLFSFMTFISINMVKGLGKVMMNSVGNLGYELSEQFTVGVCKQLCFYTGYKNQEK